MFTVNKEQVASVTQFEKCAYISKTNLSFFDMPILLSDGMKCQLEHDDYPLTVYDGTEWKVPHYLSAMYEYFRRNHQPVEETPPPVTANVLKGLVDEGLCREQENYFLVCPTFNNYIIIFSIKIVHRLFYKCNG